MEPKPRIGVIGPSETDAPTLALAEQVGSEIAKRGAILLCGVMEAAAHGAVREHGLTVGILPTPTAASANPFIDIPIATGMGEARNVILVRSADAVIAIAGGYGTLSEIAFALRLGIPVVGLGTWQVRAPDGRAPVLTRVVTPQEAVEKAFQAIRR